MNFVFLSGLTKYNRQNEKKISVNFYSLSNDANWRKNKSLSISFLMS